VFVKDYVYDNTRHYTTLYDIFIYKIKKGDHKGRPYTVFLPYNYDTSTIGLGCEE